MLNEVQSAIDSRPAGTRLVFLSDYDGTLAGFHKDPTIPRPTKETQELLCRLAERAIFVRHDRSPDAGSPDLRTTQLRAACTSRVCGMEIEVGARRWQHPDLGGA
jgi:hypothetical protein